MSVQNSINVVRILRTAMFLATVPPPKFNLNSWADHEGPIDAADQVKLGLTTLQQGARCTIKPTADQLAHTCGTTACALGYAGSIPENVKEGLQLFTSASRSSFWPIHSPEFGKSWVEFHTHLPSGRKVVYKDFSAGVKFFGITFSESFELFDPDKYSDPEQPKRSDYSTDYQGESDFKEALYDFKCRSYDTNGGNWTPSPIDVVKKFETLLRKYGKKAEADKLAKCPRFTEIRWANQFGHGVKYELRTPK